MNHERDEEIELNEEFLSDLEKLLDKYEDMNSVEVVVQLLSMAYSIMQDAAPSLEEGHEFMQSMLQKMYDAEETEDYADEDEEDVVLD
jgi:hypothetical protein